MAVTRHFLRLGNRRVHYWRAGEGPPAVLIHSSPANSRLLRPEIDWLSPGHTVFAFDTPGFGLSDPLSQPVLTVADLADALADVLVALKMPRCPVYGTHTGAAIAVELGRRHPELVSGLVLDGVPIFTEAEIATNFGSYFLSLPVTDLGGVYSEAWTRFRDQATWFPWTERRAANLNDYDLSRPESTHLWVAMYFDAADHYIPAYRAALTYGPQAAAAVAALEVPCIFTATDTDMLYPHLQRLPELKTGQEVRKIGRSNQAKLELIAEGFARFGATGSAPDRQTVLTDTLQPDRVFVEAGGQQVHLWHCGKADSGKVVLLLHDAPGSGAQIAGLLRELGHSSLVIAPDLPGLGETASIGPATLDAWSDLLEQLLRKLGQREVILTGLGFGSSLAARFAVRYPDRVAQLVICGALLPEPDERSDLIARYAPPIAVAEDGSHWYRTWLMLRDSRVWWPWYERKRDNQRGQDMDLDAATLHRWVVDVMRQRETYAALIDAALAGDLADDLGRLAVPVTAVVDAPTALSVYDEKLAVLVQTTRNARRDTASTALAILG